ncbi:MAG: OmpA family protein [Desulfuromonadales bacterium]|jgi:peptidoglycan-associated lipoprotein
MKNLVALILATMLLAGCAGKTAVNDPPANDVAPAPVAVEPEPVAPPQAVIEPVPVAVEEQKEAVKRAADTIFFAFDSYLLTGDSKNVLTGNALWLQAQPQARILIEGHADARGTDAYNLALGEKRARAARDFLTDLGIAQERIEILSYGEKKANQEANSEDVWEKDRRAQFVMSN